jgi:LysM repeat protein
MKRQSFQKKRLPTGGGSLFVFHSRTPRRKKQRVAASVDLASEVPNLGVARALLVILVLHVAAIAAIFIHNRVTDDDVVTTGSESKNATSAFGRQDRESATAAKGGEIFYFVSTGDTYERIARLKSVDAQELRDLNNGKGLDPGAILRIPTNRIASTAETASGNPVPVSDAPEPPITPVNQVSAVVEPRVPRSGEKGATSSTVRGGREQAAPPSRLQGGDPTPASSRQVPAPEQGRIYAVKSGDTAWGIAQQHDVSVQELLEANEIKDARRLQVNMKLRIPTR